jgi:hypothetical protein
MRQNFGSKNNISPITLALRGLEEPFFQLCCCVNFLFWREIGFSCTYYYVLRVPYSCGVLLVFGFWREIVFGVTYVLSVQYSCVVVTYFFVVAEKLILYEFSC